MAKGKDYELSMKNRVIEATDDYVTAMRPDYSGNSKHSVADIRITHFDGQYVDDYYVELKKRSGPEGHRQRVMSGSSSGESGVEELNRLIDGTPPWATPIVAVKFDHRELITINANRLLSELVDDNGDGSHGARTTPADSISMVKPTLDSGWKSSTAGEPDHIRLLHDLGISDNRITEDYT